MEKFKVSVSNGYSTEKAGMNFFYVEFLFIYSKSEFRKRFN